MEPTDIDKSAGKRYGYIPEYSVWRNGFPLLVVEAKAPEETIQKAVRDLLCGLRSKTPVRPTEEKPGELTWRRAK